MSADQKQKLSGWLFNTLHYVVKNLDRARRSRQRHEQQLASALPDTCDPEPTDEEVEKLAQTLDAAVAKLRAPDRLALLLRYYQNQDIPAIARTLNATEPAVRKRLSRAIARLRHHLRNAALSESALTLAAARGTSQLPLHLSGTLAHLGAASATIPSTIAVSIKGATTLMAIAKLQTAGLIAAAVCLILVPTTYFIVQARGPSTNAVAIPTAAATTTTAPANDYRAYYALSVGETLKVVNAPSAVRAAMYTALQSPQDHSIVAPPGVMLFDWNNGAPQNPLIYVQPQLPLNEAVAGLAALALNLKPNQITITAAISTTPFTLPGDIVYDNTVPREQVLPALETAFHTRMNLNLKLTLAGNEKVYVLSGMWKFTPIPNADPRNTPQVNGTRANPLIEIYGSTVYDPNVEKPASGDTIDADGLATQISEWIGHPVVIQATGVPNIIGWRWNNSAALTTESERAVHEPASVLKHITEQTALTWKEESRPARHLLIEPK